MELIKDFKEFIELLNENEVKYLVIGGYAVNFHGYPRYTRDIDFWVWMNEENVDKLLYVLREFGFGSLGLDVDDFMSPENIIQLGFEPNRIDLLVDANGAEFESCFGRKTEKEVDGVTVKFLSIEDLIVVKKEAGRLKDLADAEELENILKKKNDQKKSDE